MATYIRVSKLDPIFVPHARIRHSTSQALQLLHERSTKSSLMHPNNSITTLSPQPAHANKNRSACTVRPDEQPSPPSISTSRVLARMCSELYLFAV